MLIERLSAQSGVSVSKLNRLALFASYKYKSYFIDKRTVGKRQIHHPSRELKAIQRWLIASVFNQLPLHSVATAYRIGHNIRINADRHKDSNFTVRVDFADFFPSFTLANIAHFLARKNDELRFGWSEEDIDFVSKIVTRHGNITIGAPSSPMLTNAMMYDFDEQLFLWTELQQLIYTRYADDVFISSKLPGALTEVVTKIQQCCQNYEFGNLQINNEKTSFLSKRYRRSITGLIVTPDNQISIGRGRKREIRAMVHKKLTGTLPKTEYSRLRGLLAFASDVEPNFISSLIRKHSKFDIENLLHAPY